MADEPKTETQAPAPPAAPPDPTTDAYKALLAKHNNDANAVALALFGEAQSLRDKARELKGRLPAEGSTVLAGDDAKAWTEYRSLGAAADLRAALADRDRFKGEADGFRRAETVRGAAELHGLKPSVLATLARDHAIVFREEKSKDGKSTVRVAHVQGEGETTTPLVEFAEREWKDFLPALRADAAPVKPVLGSPARTGTLAPKPVIAPEKPRKSLVR